MFHLRNKIIQLFKNLIKDFVLHDNLNEKCSVVGIFGHQEASKLAYFSLHSLQHRGQEAAGISSADGKKLHTIKKRGLVMRVFDEDKLRTLSGSAAIGHTRYSTAGDDSILDAYSEGSETKKDRDNALKKNNDAKEIYKVK